MMTLLLQQLWSLTGRDPTSSENEWNDYFDAIGLNLIGRPHRWEYWCTPRNSLTFATTGGDGVHFGLLNIGHGFSDESPVVMTVPCSDTPNTVVGENLSDFLRLGCCAGYYRLEQLVYERDELLAILDSHQPNPEANEHEPRLLRLIRERLDLAPWSSHRERLDQLRETYFRQVEAIKVT